MLPPVRTPPPALPRVPGLDPSRTFEQGQMLLIDKPLGWTSFDVVARLRTLTRCRKIGHAGTLDPLATGLLVICTGAATKQIDALQSADKDYVAEFRLGYTTASYDAEQPLVPGGDPSGITAEAITHALAAFRGTIEQRPPAFSAVKVGGRRAYRAARAGAAPEMPPRSVTVSELELLSYSPEQATGTLRMTCSKGTYVRSLVHDLGQALGVGAYLSGLVRTRSGEFLLKDALSLEELAAALAADAPSGTKPSGTASGELQS